MRCATRARKPVGTPSVYPAGDLTRQRAVAIAQLHGRRILKGVKPSLRSPQFFPRQSIVSRLRFGGREKAGNRQGTKSRDARETFPTERSGLIDRGDTGAP